MLTGDTIAAISSAVGPAARMIVRASGPGVSGLLSTLVPEARTHSFARRYPIECRGLRIPAWVYLFIAPRSYSGEDLIEFHIPGNAVLARMLLQELIHLGARSADPGEFTARAYFNGRIDLAQAEGVAAVIAAQGDRQLAAARQLLAGELARRLGPIMDGLTQTLALLESGIDFSEEDISFLSQEQLTRQIAQADAALIALLNDSARFDRVFHEPRIVLVGRPNAGKSTLLNALCGHDRAVVSPHAGTTRDAIWATVHLKRGAVRMIDVAGIDDAPGDDIFRQMQQRARQIIQQADHVVLVRECGDDGPVLHLGLTPALCMITKSDLNLKSESSKDWLHVSAATGRDMDVLRSRLDTIAFGGPSVGGESLALNSRHVQAIQDARDALAHIQSPHAGAEISAMELRQALDALGQVLGRVTPDDVLGRIFSTFCVGK